MVRAVSAVHAVRCFVTPQMSHAISMHYSIGSGQNCQPLWSVFMGQLQVKIKCDQAATNLSLN